MVLTTALQDYIEQNNPEHVATKENCKPAIFSKGIPVIILDGKSEPMEVLIQAAAKMLNMELDWHYSGGRAQVLLLGGQNEHAIATKWFQDNMKVRLEIDFTKGFEVPAKINQLFDSEYYYSRVFATSGYSNCGNSLKIVIDDHHATVIKTAFEAYQVSNQVFVDTNYCWLPFDTISGLNYVPFGGMGRYRSENEGVPVDNSNIDEFYVVR
jgi:hypothetical protein